MDPVDVYDDCKIDSIVVADFRRTLRNRNREDRERVRVALSFETFSVSTSSFAEAEFSVSKLAMLVSMVPTVPGKISIGVLPLVVVAPMVCRVFFLEFLRLYAECCRFCAGPEELLIFRGLALVRDCSRGDCGVVERRWFVVVCGKV